MVCLTSNETDLFLHTISIAPSSGILLDIRQTLCYNIKQKGGGSNV